MTTKFPDSMTQAKDRVTHQDTIRLAEFAKKTSLGGYCLSQTELADMRFFTLASDRWSEWTVRLCVYRFNTSRAIQCDLRIMNRRHFDLHRDATADEARRYLHALEIMERLTIVLGELGWTHADFGHGMGGSRIFTQRLHSKATWTQAIMLLETGYQRIQRFAREYKPTGAQCAAGVCEPSRGLLKSWPHCEYPVGSNMESIATDIGSDRSRAWRYRRLERCKPLMTRAQRQLTRFADVTLPDKAREQAGERAAALYRRVAELGERPKSKTSKKSGPKKGAS